MKNKPRGSQLGLKKNRADTKSKNTSAMWEVIQRLRNEKPSAIWTYKEVWQGAGLKSHVPLSSPWNVSVRGAIDAHNSEVQQRIELGAPVLAQRRTLRDANRELLKRIKELTAERDLALSKIAVHEADADYYRSQCQNLALINTRLRNQRST
ncbi:hypothetical protein [Pseudomonas arcuscaelestis]|uniref:hypothetical protein n=1 Tax=Pseudomonas arcuscaelestis TaxID=2710591 RepID=UPI00193E20EA|nr:hypothetical protein [Pseudomonas arcuscaelestis]MBM3110764.1 hypothetical protein [Pseudomonas arcuscaelestis]